MNWIHYSLAKGSFFILNHSAWELNFHHSPATLPIISVTFIYGHANFLDLEENHGTKSNRDDLATKAVRMKIRPPQERDTGTPSTAMYTHSQTPQIIQNGNITLAKIHFHTPFLFYKFVSTNQMQFWHLSGKEFRWSYSLTGFTDSRCVPFLQNHWKNTSPTLLPSLSSMLKLKGEVLQIHVHVNVKYIQILNLQYLYVKLIWHLNI